MEGRVALKRVGNSQQSGFVESATRQLEANR
jgi:hypothetical protein